MGKIIVEKTGQGVVVTNRLSPGEQINEQELKLIAEGASFGLLPVRLENKKRDRALSCTAARLLPLDSYFSGVVTRRMFEDTVSRLVAVVRGCAENGFEPGNLCLSPKHCFIEPRTKEVKCILWPLINNELFCSPEAFFRDLPYTLVFNKNEDCTYVAGYIRYFGANAAPFSIDGFGQFFEESVLGGKKDDMAAAAPKRQEQPYDPLKRMIEQKAGGAGRNACPNCGVVNAAGAKICVSCGTALIEPGSRDEAPKTGTAVLGNSPGTTGTEAEESPYPYLIRESTHQIISVDKPEFRMGKDKNSVDFCVAGNTAISRSHAIIRIRDDRYFIEDQNSTNKTYIDGRAISPGQEVEIFPGARIRLANEEFVFYI